MNSLTDRDQGREPYGLVLLCLSIFGIIGLAVCIVGLAGLAATFIDTVLYGWRPTADRIAEVVQATASENSILGIRAVLVLSVVIYGAVIVAILAFAHWRGGPAWRDLVAWRPLAVGLGDRWLWAIVIAAAAYSVAAPFFLSRFDQHAHLAFKIPADTPASLIFVALAVFVAPVTEELMFRGWIYTGLRHRLGVWPALILSAVFFAFAHYEDTHIYALAILPVGLALGGMRERAGSIKAPILFHAFYNLAAVVLTFYD
jgi:membrane protease YdiL (CAAX protease family)